MKTFTIWYMRPDHLPRGLMGEKPDARALERTHVRLKTLDLPDDNTLDDVYYAMQGETWSPNGEARPLIRELGLRHTSMSIGDVIVDPQGFAYCVASFGFQALGAAA